MEKALEQLKRSLSRVKSGKTVKLMKKLVLSDMTVATGGSRRDISIGEVKFDVRIDYPRPKTNPKYRFWRVPAHTLMMMHANT